MNSVLYAPPCTRREAVDEVMRTGFTISAMLAVALAFPLPGELDVTVSFNRARDGALDHFFAEACAYLHEWGRGSCRI